MKIIRKFYNNYKQKKSTPKTRRHDDIYLVSFPKSGNTWVSFLIANVISEYLNLNVNINFNTVRKFVPDIHMERSISNEITGECFSRIIKSHSEYNTYYNTIFLLIRDPKDIMISYYYYLTNRNKFKGTINEFIKSKKYGIENWVSHTESWLENIKTSQRLYIITFEDLKESTYEVVDRIFKIMGFKIDKNIINNSISKSDLSNMRDIENLTGGYSYDKYSEFDFIRKGKKGEGKKELTSKQIDYINNKVRDIYVKINK